MKTFVGRQKLNIIRENEIRFFLGYSGWSSGQLDEEYKSKTWILIENDHENLLEIDAGNLWREVLKKQGGKYKEISNYPLDPRLN